MLESTGATPEQPQWEQVAEHLERLAQAPTRAQFNLATSIGLDLQPAIPAYVAAVVLRHALKDVLYERTRAGAEIPKALRVLERELGIKKSQRARLLTGTREEVSGWFAARYAVKSARGLRDLQPEVGDIVVMSGRLGEQRLISSISPTGRIYMRGRPSRSAWPNNLLMGVRVADPAYESGAREIDAQLRNGATYSYSNFTKLEALREFELDSNIPSPESLRELEELLESGERLEEPFQDLITRHPALLAAATVVGGWKTYVIPKQRLGTEHVTDFLVLSINSLGPQWVTVEIEAPRHGILIQDGSLSQPTRHAVKQVNDWQEWLTQHIAYAHEQYHLYGLTNRAPGLVIIGRDDPKAERDASRAQSAEGSRIQIHSWDWLLRHARSLAENSLHLSGFARAHTFGGTEVADPDGDDPGKRRRPREDTRPESDEHDPYELELDDIF